MKNLTLILLFVSLIQIIHAQEEQVSQEQEVEPHSKFVLGGSINFLTQNNSYPLIGISSIIGDGSSFANITNESKNTTFAFSPYFGIETNPHTILGLQFDYRTTVFIVKDLAVFGKSDLTDYETISNQLGFGIFYRHTLNPEKHFNIYLQPFFEYSFLREKDGLTKEVELRKKANFMELGVGIGGLYNINDKMRITLSTGGISYISGSWEDIDRDQQKDFNSFRTSFNISSIFFGFELKI